MGDAGEYPLSIAFELTDFAARMRGSRHRREHPDATDAEVEAVVHTWMLERPMAPRGDSEGAAVDLSRFT